MFISQISTSVRNALTVALGLVQTLLEASSALAQLENRSEATEDLVTVTYDISSYYA